MSGAGGSAFAGLWTIERLCRQLSLRSKLVSTVVLLSFAWTGFMAFYASGDGTPSGRMQAFLSATVDFDIFVLSLATVFLSTSLASSLREGRLVQVVAAPVRREIVLLGWWLGVSSVLLLLVLVCGLWLGLGISVIGWTAPEEDQAEIERVLQSRYRVVPKRPDAAAIEAEVLDDLARRIRAGRLPEEMSPEEAFEQLERSLRTRRRSVPRGKSIRWSLTGIEHDDLIEPLVLRFRYRVAETKPIGLERNPPVAGRFRIGRPGGSLPHRPAGTWPGGRDHDILVPSHVLDGQTALDVVYQNLDRRPLVVVFPEAGVQILYPAGSFKGNLLRAWLVLYGRLLFLAAVGVASSALLDRRLAAAVALWFLVIGSGAGFLKDSLRPGTFGALDGPVQVVLKAVLFVLPDLGRQDLAGLLAGSEAVSGAAVLSSVFGDGFGRGGFVLFLGALLFARRELGATRE